MCVIASNIYYIRYCDEVTGLLASCTEHKLNVGFRITEYFKSQSFYKLDGKTGYLGLYLNKSCT